MREVVTITINIQIQVNGLSFLGHLGKRTISQLEHYGTSIDRQVGIGEIDRKMGIEYEKNNVQKNKYSGSNFDDFLKEEGIYEDVKTLAQKELKVLRDKGSLESDAANELPNNLRNRIRRLFQRIRHVIIL